MSSKHEKKNSGITEIIMKKTNDDAFPFGTNSQEKKN